MNVELDYLCVQIMQLCENKEYDACLSLLYEAMKVFPHDAQPHNLMGIVLEKMGNHLLAMKHFRAAWALNPSYLPSSRNMELYGTFGMHRLCLYDEEIVFVEEDRKGQEEVI